MSFPLHRTCFAKIYRDSSLDATLRNDLALGPVLADNPQRWYFAFRHVGRHCVSSASHPSIDPRGKQKIRGARIFSTGGWYDGPYALIACAYLSRTNTRHVRRALSALFGGAVGKDTSAECGARPKATETVPGTPCLLPTSQSSS